MKVINTSARLICVQTEDGRVDILPGVVVDDKRLDKVKGNNKVVDFYFSEGTLKEVKASPKKTEKELLVEDAEGLDIDTTDMTIAELKAAIAEALED